MILQVQVWDCVDNSYNRKRTHIEIPCLNPCDLERAIKYCEQNHITGVLFDLETLCGNEWWFVKGCMCGRERFEEFVYGL